MVFARINHCFHSPSRFTHSCRAMYTSVCGPYESFFSSHPRRSVKGLFWVSWFFPSTCKLGACYGCVFINKFILVLIVFFLLWIWSFSPCSRIQWFVPIWSEFTRQCCARHMSTNESHETLNSWATPTPESILWNWLHRWSFAYCCLTDVYYNSLSSDAFAIFISR